MRLAFISSDHIPDSRPPQWGGCAWYRAKLPVEALAGLDHDVTLAPTLFFDHGELKAVDAEGNEHGGFDIVVVQRVMDARLAPIIRECRDRGQIIINDVDDWFDGMAPSNIAFGHLAPSNSPTWNRDHYRKALAASSALIVSTPYLARRLAPLGRPTYVIRNPIDLGRWDQVAAERPVDRPLTVGWVGNLPWRSGDLETLRGIIGPWVRRNDARFYHGGQRSPFLGGNAGHIAGVPPESCDGALPTSMADYPSLWAGLDVSLAPLNDCPFSRAKSSIKPFEAIASGVPSIGTALDEYQWAASQGIGVVARRPRDWLRQLDRYSDPDMRTEDAQAGRVALKAHDISERVGDWVDVFEKVTR